MAKAKRTALEPGIYRYADGRLEARFTVAGVPYSKHFAAGTPIALIRQWITDQRETLGTERRAYGTATRSDRTAGAGTLETDAIEYWSQIAGRPSFAADRSHTRAWFDVEIDGQRLGALPRLAWTAAHVNKAIAQWQAKPSAHAIRKIRVKGYSRPETTIPAHAIAGATVRAHARLGDTPGTVKGYARKGSTIATHTAKAHAVPDYVRTAPATSGAIVSALTIRHRCRVLAELWKTLDGPKAPTPVDDAKIPARSQHAPLIVPAATVATVIENLARQDPKDFARFFLFAVTAQRPCQIGRAQPGDLDLDDARTWVVRNAKGEPAHLIALNAQQIAAWRVFIAANAWGEIDTTKYGRAIHAAGWPNGIRPYNARHSLAVDAIKRGISIGDLQGLLGHSSPETTRRFYAPFQLQQQRAVSDRMAPYLADVLKPRLVSRE
jgi:integrase